MLLRIGQIKLMLYERKNRIDKQLTQLTPAKQPLQYDSMTVLKSHSEGLQPKTSVESSGMVPTLRLRLMRTTFAI